MARYVGVDLGATNVRAAVADGSGEPIGRDRQSTPRGPGGIAVTEAVLSVVRGACEAADVGPGSLTAAGVGSIGPLDLAEGAVTDPANLPDHIEHVPLVGPIQELIDSDRVYLHNDTSAGVIGQRFYSELSPDDMVYLTVSSGIGAGVAVDGNVLTGWDGNAGEVGHVTVDPEGQMPCGCGGVGHWEAYCSGDNIPAYAAHVHDREGIGTDLPVHDPEFSAADLFEAAGEDPLADDVVDRVADWNAIGVATVVAAYAPIVVYLGGAVALNNPEVVVDPIRERLDDLVMSNVPEIRLTSLGEDVVVLGAVASAMTGGTGDKNRA
jgi:glucokinase